MNLNKDIIKKWVEALRSGEYVQGNGSLRDADDNYCCLGVLCDLHAKAGLGSWDESSAILTGRHSYGIDHATMYLPHPVAAWAGIDPMRMLDLPLAGSRAATLNDNGYTFAQIADLIEKEYA